MGRYHVASVHFSSISLLLKSCGTSHGRESLSQKRGIRSPMLSKVRPKWPCSCCITSTCDLLLEEKQKGEARGEGRRVGWLVAVVLCPVLGRHMAAQARRRATRVASPYHYPAESSSSCSSLDCPLLEACPRLRTAADSSLF